MKQNHIFIAITLFSLLALAAALISQHVFGMAPCAWCVLQRFILIICAVIGIIGWLTAKNTILKQIMALLGLATSIWGIASAWYQYSVAANLFSCAQTFADKFILTLKLDNYMPWLFGIYATCADAKVSLFGIEYALWGFTSFVLLAVLNIFILFNRFASSHIP